MKRRTCTMEETYERNGVSQNHAVVECARNRRRWVHFEHLDVIGVKIHQSTDPVPSSRGSIPDRWSLLVPALRKDEP
jgi:hypothetical protein